jgi:hypothetical protein
MASRTAGYSGTPLAKKLGIGASSCVWTIDAPAAYRKLLAPLPAGVRFVSKLSARVDVIHLFVDNGAALAARLTSLRKSMRSDAALWVSWPKKTSKIPTDVTEDTIRSVALPIGLVDVKVCAVNEVWSGLKLVIRKELR